MRDNRNNFCRSFAVRGFDFELFKEEKSKHKSKLFKPKQAHNKLSSKKYVAYQVAKKLLVYHVRLQIVRFRLLIGYQIKARAPRASFFIVHRFTSVKIKS